MTHRSSSTMMEMTRIDHHRPPPDDDDPYRNTAQDTAPSPEQASPQEEDNEDERIEKQKYLRQLALVVCLALVAVIIVATTIGVLASQNKSNGQSQHDKSTVSNAPTPSPSILIALTPQEKLDFVRQALLENEFTKETALPTSVTALERLVVERGESSVPIVRAAHWLVSKDTFLVTNKQSLLRRLGLASFYYSNGGEGWTNATNWLFATVSHCDWYGVWCCGGYLEVVSPTCSSSDTQEIVYLSMENNNVTGSLSNSSFGLLSSLRGFDLSRNHLTGEIPGALLGSFPKLLVIFLQHNQLSGQVPGEVRKNGALDTLLVQRNNLTGTWPLDLCLPQMTRLGFDCDKVKCPYRDCCKPDEFCFYGDE